MFELIVIKSKGHKLVDSKILHKELEVASNHADWIRRRIENYGFLLNEDYYSNMSVRSDGKAGKKRKEYYLTFDMVKELCMLENNDKGKATRKYFINYEKNNRNKEVIELASKEVRKSLTDAVEESGEQERMHNYGFSTYTLMVYKWLGIKKDYQQWKKSTGGKGEYRKTLSTEMREKVANAEGLVKGMLNLQKQHAEIKATLEPLFTIKEIK